MRFNPSVLAVLAGIFWSCSPSGPADRGQERAPAESLVAFRFPSMHIDRLEKPVAPPYAAGSARAGGLLSSSDPAVVEADGNGMLIAHRNGDAVIRSRSGVSLQVFVRAGRQLRIDPPRLELKTGTEQKVAVKADGEPVDGRALRWLSEDPSVAVGSGLKVIAGRSPGSATLTAVLGDARATVTVLVDGVAGR